MEEGKDDIEHRLRVQGNVLDSERRKRISEAEKDQESETVSVNQFENTQRLLDKRTK